MGRVILARLATAIPLLLATSLLSFLLLHWAPGSFVDRLKADPKFSERAIEELAKRFALDRPWYEQYAMWLSWFVRGELGPSAAYQRPVSELLRERAPRTFVLAATSYFLCLAVGIALALVSLRRLDGIWDRFFCRASLTLISVHPIVLAFIGMSLAARAGLPIGGGSSLEASSLGPFWRFYDYVLHLLLPATVLMLVMLPGFFLHARGALSEILPASFVRAGQARGLAESTIVWRHVLPFGLVSLIGFAGSAIGRLLNGAFLVEVTTGYPGLGSLALGAVLDRDPFLLLGTLIVAGALLCLGTLVADLLLAGADPRISLEESSP